MAILIFGLVCGCAPAGHFYETGSFVARPRDACALPESAAEFAAALNRKVGQREGPRQGVVSVQGLKATGPIVESKDQLISCRGKLVFTDGQTENGTISVVEREGQRIVQASWDSDEATGKRQVEQQALIAQAQRNVQPIPPPSQATTPIEKDAIMFEASTAWLDQTEKLVRLVKGNDFACDSVSASRPMVMSFGYVLVCNKFRHTYDIQDKGGHWTVSVR